MDIKLFLIIFFVFIVLRFILLSCHIFFFLNTFLLIKIKYMYLYLKNKKYQQKI